MIVRRTNLYGRAHLFRPVLFCGIDDLFDRLGDIQQVIALALNHLQRDGRFSIEPRRAIAILKCQADVGQFAQGDDAVPIGFYRQGIDVCHLFETRGNFDRKAALRCFNIPGCDQLIVILHH